MNDQYQAIETNNEIAVVEISSDLAASQAQKSAITAANSAAVATESATSAGNSLIQAQSSANKAFASENSALNSATAANNYAALAAQGAGSIAFPSVTTMNADLNHAANILALVTNDPTASNNGYYIKVGASGTGSWQKSSYVPPVMNDTIATSHVLDGAITKRKTGFGQLMLNDPNGITLTGTTITISDVRYGRNDGTWVEMPKPLSFALTGAFDYFVADGNGESPYGLTITKGTHEHPWQEQPNLGKDQFILLYRNNGFWFSDFPCIQTVLDAVPGSEKGKGILSVVPIGNNENITFSGSKITLNGIRVMRTNGTYQEQGQAFTAEFGGPYDYLVADATTNWEGPNDTGLVITKGIYKYAWQDPLGLYKTIILAKNEQTVFSLHPAIQTIIAGIYGGYNFPDSVTFSPVSVGDIIVSDTSISIAGLRAGRDDGTYVDLSSPITFTATGLYDYFIADAGHWEDGKGGTTAMTIIKGTKTYFWQENLSNTYQRIIAGKNNGIWFSPIPFIQNAINRFYNPTSTAQFNRIEKIVKAGGTVGTDCDFTNIKAALDAITDNSATNRYTVRVLNGTYDVSNDGNLFLGMKNYVDIVGQSRSGVIVIKRENTAGGDGVDASKSTFDPAYYGQTINYASLRNMTIISKNTKCPVHIDNGLLDGTIEIIDCNLINENVPGQGNYQNGLACGLRKNQRVVAKGVYTNGMLWAHNGTAPYSDEGCHFELYNCISKFIMVGDLVTYGKDVFIAEGCKADYLRYLYYRDYPSATDSHLRSYRVPSWSFELRGNSFEYIDPVVIVGSNVLPSPSAIDEVYSGRWGICEPSIHNYCKNVSSSTINRFSLVSLTIPEDMNGITAWTPGCKLYGIALDTIAANDFGIVQYAGSVDLVVDASTPIAYNDSLELNNSGVAVKHITGAIIGYARQAASSGIETIKVRLTKF